MDMANVLVLNDDRSALNTLRSMFENDTWGTNVRFNPFCFEDQRTALESIAEREYDLALIDFGVERVELQAELRKQEALLFLYTGHYISDLVHHMDSIRPTMSKEEGIDQFDALCSRLDNERLTELINHHFPEDGVVVREIFEGIRDILDGEYGPFCMGLSGRTTLRGG